MGGIARKSADGWQLRLWVAPPPQPSPASRERQYRAPSPAKRGRVGEGVRQPLSTALALCGAAAVVERPAAGIVPRGSSGQRDALRADVRRFRAGAGGRSDGARAGGAAVRVAPGQGRCAAALSRGTADHLCRSRSSVRTDWRNAGTAAVVWLRLRRPVAAGRRVVPGAGGASDGPGHGAPCCPR